MNFRIFAAALNGLIRQLKTGLRAHIWFLGAIGLFAVVGKIVAVSWGLNDHFQIQIYDSVLNLLLCIFLVILFVGHSLFVMVVIRPDRPLLRVLQDYRERIFLPERLTNAAILLLVLPVFFSVFTCFKAMIPALNPYGWDETFSRWDQALHGNVAPWQILHPVLGFPAATVVINFVYHLWFFVLNAVFLWQAFSMADPRRRMQFLMTSVLIWSILGILMATMLSSAGPCYFHHFSDQTNPYSPLMTYLHETARTHYIPAVEVQQMLLSSYQTGQVEVGSGISAMPSMHVSSAFLFVLLSWNVNCFTRWGFITFFVFILVGSVHLGWHYAIDGYIVIPLTWLIWRMAGRLLDLDPLFHQQDQADDDPLIHPAECGDQNR